MKRFHFPLQAVHNLRELRLEQAENVLAQAVIKVVEAQNRLEEIVVLRQRAIDEYTSKISTGILNTYEISMNLEYLDVLAQREAEARSNLVKLEKECEVQRKNVAEAARKAEATAKLREKHQSRYQAEVARAEQDMIDEMATISSSRKLRGL
jgi:flagellar export protein FliJ